MVKFCNFMWFKLFGQKGGLDVIVNVEPVCDTKKTFSLAFEQGNNLANDTIIEQVMFLPELAY